VLEELARQIANKFMHAPLAALNSVLPEEQEAMLTTVRRLYRLHE
jgi:glutamyl-tRNA reductase